MRSDLWSPEQDAQLAALCADGLPGREVAEILNAEFGTAFTKNAVLARKFRLKLPSCCPQRRARRSSWTPERREAQVARMKRYWKNRRADSVPLEPKKQFVFETVEQFLARGGTIRRIEPRPDDYQPGTPVYPTAAR